MTSKITKHRQTPNRAGDESTLFIEAAAEILRGYEYSCIYLPDEVWLKMYSLSVLAIREEEGRTPWDTAWASEPADRALQKALAGKHYLRDMHLTVLYDGVFRWSLATAPGMRWEVDRSGEQLLIVIPAADWSQSSNNMWRWSAPASDGEVSWEATGQIAAGGYLPTPRPPNKAHAFSEWCRVATLAPPKGVLGERD